MRFNGFHVAATGGISVTWWRRGAEPLSSSSSQPHDVQASVRMNPDLMNEGYAAGYTAAAMKAGFVRAYPYETT